MYNTYYNITLLNDTISGGVGLTTEEHNQLSSIYNKLYTGIYLGEIINVSLTGSHTNASYPTKVVYINQTSTVVHLLGTINLGSTNYANSKAFRWNVTATINSNTYTINNCMTPTSNQIYTYASGYFTGFNYWLNDNPDGYGWSVLSGGAVGGFNDATHNESSSYCIIPYIIINL